MAEQHITKEGGVSNQLPLPASAFGDPTAVAEAIKATLLKDPTINGAITISAGDARDDHSQSQKQTGDGKQGAQCHDERRNRRANHKKPVDQPLTGGYGSIFGIVLGTLAFAIVNQGIYYTGFDANWANLIIGILLLVAVLMNNTFRKMALAYAPKKQGVKA